MSDEQELRDEIERLRVRQQELLATIVRITNETPYPEELQGWESQRAALLAEVGTLRAKVTEYEERARIAEAIRDDARAASQRYLDDKRRVDDANLIYAELLASQEKRIVEDRAARGSAWAKGVQACIDVVKQRHAHYELYRCDCVDADPAERSVVTGHRPGCKGEMMSTKPATFAILDEIYTFLQALLSRGQP